MVMGGVGVETGSGKAEHSTPKLSTSHAIFPRDLLCSLLSWNSDGHSQRSQLRSWFCSSGAHHLRESSTSLVFPNTPRTPTWWSRVQNFPHSGAGLKSARGPACFNMKTCFLSFFKTCVDLSTLMRLVCFLLFSQPVRSRKWVVGSGLAPLVISNTAVICWGGNWRQNSVVGKTEIKLSLPPLNFPSQCERNRDFKSFAF